MLVISHSCAQQIGSQSTGSLCFPDEQSLLGNMHLLIGTGANLKSAPPANLSELSMKPEQLPKFIL